MTYEKRIVLKSTGALGDLIIASALAVGLNQLGYSAGIISRKFTLPLWNGLDNVAVYDDISKVPNDVQVVDISDYLSNFPNSKNLPLIYTGKAGEKKGHLCEWMAYSASQRSGIPIKVSREDVRIMLTTEEIKAGKDKVFLASEGRHKPVVVIAPYATTKNKNIPRKALEQIVREISKFAVPCLLEPFSPEQYIEGAKSIGDKDLRIASAILYAADAYLGVDSGPLHMINGAIQGEKARGMNVRMDNIIAVTGSSDPDVCTYQDNRIIKTIGGCPVNPCGAHKYCPIEKYDEVFGRVFYPSGREEDKSGCIFENYAELDTAPCLESINPEEVIETIRDILK